MRIAFVNTLIKAAQKNNKIILMTGDLGYSVFENYIEQLPDQYVNCGVAEQNMAGMAAGMAMEGYIPVIYSIIPFTTMRNFEQIRNDICYQNLNVKIVGVGAGFSYGPYGHTHHALEDIGIMRTLANMTIFAPGDPVEAKLCARAMFKKAGPVYLRIGKKGEPVIHSKRPVFKVGSLLSVCGGKKIALVACSTMLETAVKTATILETENRIQPAVLSCPTIKPINQSEVLQLSEKYDTIVTIEEHSIIGGLGSAFAEIFADQGLASRLIRISVPDRFTKVSGNQDFMRKANGLLPEQIVTTILS